MRGSVSWRASNISQTSPAAGRAVAPLTGLGGLAATLVTGLVLVVGAVLAVIFAATVAMVMALASVLLGLTALVWRMRRRQPQPVRAQGRAAGHSWVAYNWDGRQITSGS